MADLIIRGMEMPKEGGKILIAAGGSVWVNAWPTRGYVRMENVYAVPLPEGHGRLIDADTLIENHFSDEHRIALSPANKLWMRRIIKGEPTIIEAEGGTDDDGSRKEKTDSPRLTCRDPEGRARLMPDVDLMAAIERLCQIEERGMGVLIMPRAERQVRITEALKRKWKERRSGNASQ